jgi:hypothetical protein
MLSWRDVFFIPSSHAGTTIFVKSTTVKVQVQFMETIKCLVVIIKAIILIFLAKNQNDCL